MFNLTLKHNLIRQGDYYRVQIWVDSYEDGTDPKIFVYQYKALLPDEEGPENEFSHVASAADMEEYPADAISTHKQPFFRKSYCDLLFNDPSMIRSALVRFNVDVRQLLDNLNKLETELVSV